MALATNINELDIGSNTPAKVKQQTRIEQPLGKTLISKNQDLHYLYKQAPIGVILNLISALLICWFVMPHTPDYLYVPWLAFVVTTCFTHTLLIKEFNKHRQSLHVNNQWAIYHTFMIGLTALTFSVGYLMFLPLVDSFVQTVMLLIMATLAVSFLPVLSVFLPAYIIYISTFIFPSVFWIYSLPPESGYPIAGLLTVTYCMLIIVGSYYSKALLEAFSLAAQVNEQANKLRIMLEEKNTDNIKLKKDMYELGKYSDSAQRQKEQAEITLQAIGEAVIATDSRGRITYSNPVAEVYSGYLKKELVGKPITSIINLVDENSRVELPDPVGKCLENKSALHGDQNILLLRRDGLEYGIDYSVTPILTESGAVNGTVMVFRDTTEKRKMEKTLVWQDRHDGLTGLINRNEFNQRLVKLLANNEDREHEHALCLIDLDRFRLINDSCGNDAGDELLKKIGNRLRTLIRDTDTLARLSNDEFAVIMHSCSLEKAQLIAEIFREEINKIKFEWQDKYFSVSASIGIVEMTPSTTDDISKIYRCVEIACNKAKSAGGNIIQSYSFETDENPHFTGQLKLLSQLQQNLEQESFKVYTQRIMPLDDLNDTLIYEVLLRMPNESGNTVSADNFIQTAEAYHLLASIDKWVLKLVMEMIAYGNPVFKKASIINVNISQQSIFNDKFADYVKQLIEDYEVEAGKICLEINERCFYGNINLLKRFVTVIKQLGCKVALDDFNYNPETINTVRELNLDFVKLDARQFSRINEESDFNYSLLESINNISHMIGAQTIVKCLDDKKMIEQLYEIGTDYIQGYAIEKPKQLNNKH